MKTIKIFLIAMLFANTALFAQNKTIKKIEKTGDVIENTEKTYENGKKLIGKIFKKNKKEEKAESNVPKNTETPSQEPEQKIEKQPNDLQVSSEKKSGRNLSNSFSVYPTLRPGDIHPDAVVLDVDNISSFNQGAAVVSKGDATGLINADGAYVIPFNKYKYPISGGLAKNGLFFVYNGNNSFLVNVNGEIIADNKTFLAVGSSSGRNFGKYFVAASASDSKKSRFIDVDGNYFDITDFANFNFNKYEKGSLYENNAGLFRFSINNIGYGFKNKKNEVVIQQEWLIADLFYENAAIVGKRNEFGETKYGYINTKGEIIIPLMYSKKPEPFSDGLAKVYATDHTYAYIDKKGQVVLSSPNFKLKGDYGSFYSGYAFDNNSVLDKNGNNFNIADFLSQFGIPKNIIGGYLGKGYLNSFSCDHSNDGKLYVVFSSANKEDNHNKLSYHALLDLKNKKTLFLWKANASIDYFDPISGLARVVESHISGTTKKMGYINEQGVYVIVKGEKSKW